MTARDDLLASVAARIAGYRYGGIPEPDGEHVDRWISQFSPDVQIPLLRETDFILDQTYFPRDWVTQFFASLVKSPKLAGADPCSYWKRANFLSIQQNGSSQADLLVTFDVALREKCGFGVADCGSADGPFIYVDDALFTGSRAGGDLARWLEQEAPGQGRVNLITIANHTLGVFQATDRLAKLARETKKKIGFEFWRSVSLENRKSYRDSSEVLWPAVLPDDPAVSAYLDENHKFPFIPRRPGGKLQNQIFSSEEGRQLLERELLVAGVRIRGFSQNPSPAMRPLGFSAFGLGFGSTIVTYRNCPNNCPLALWWGDPTAVSGPLSRWYPLLPRKTYASAADDFGFVDET